MEQGSSLQATWKLGLPMAEQAQRRREQELTRQPYPPRPRSHCRHGRGDVKKDWARNILDRACRFPAGLALCH